MNKIEVIKHLPSIDRNILGEVVKQDYCYYIAVRRFGFLWQPLKFYYIGDCYAEEKVARLLEADKVRVGYTSRFRATWFDTEADAVRIKLDILAHPDKYIKAT